MVSFLPRTALCAGALILLLGGALPRPAVSQSQALSSQSEVTLLTILPGHPVYTFAGHSAVRVRDPAQNLDRLYNYGTFSFNDPLFIPKFTYGDLRYYLSVRPTPPMLRFYRNQKRPVIEQTLNLSRSQRARIFRVLEHNARPENRYYQYDFFFDNCSTRIRDVLTTTLGDNVDFSGVASPKRTFRQMLDPYVASRPILDLGFDLALGLPADRTPSREEVMFLPEHLMDAFGEAVITVNGTRKPLVARTDTVHWAPQYRALSPAFDWPFALGLGGLLLALGWTAWQALRGIRPGGLGDALLLLLPGTIGLGACYLWFVSTYDVTEHNLNLLWAWPTHLYASYMLLRHPSAPRLRYYLVATSLGAAVFLVGWPLWPQNLHHAVLPVVGAIGVRTGWWALLLSGLAPAPPSVAPAPVSEPK
jgi:hypothetical protein